MSGPTITQVDAAVRAALAEARGPLPRPGEPEIFAGRLLSVREVARLSGATKEVRIAPGTVVTPLARDELKRRGVSLRFISQHDIPRENQAGTWGFAIEAETAPATVLRRVLLADADSWIELAGGAI